jgi:hypothetical protein
MSRTVLLSSQYSTVQYSTGRHTHGVVVVTAQGDMEKGGQAPGSIQTWKHTHSVVIVTIQGDMENGGEAPGSIQTWKHTHIRHTYINTDIYCTHEHTNTDIHRRYIYSDAQYIQTHSAVTESGMSAGISCKPTTSTLLDKM